jgi:uncharacterized RDD family membrane protein YckC
VFGRRFGALLIDLVLVFLAIVVVRTLLEALLDPLENAGLIALLMLLVLPLYKAGFESASRQATPGKRLLGVKVVRDDGERLSFGRSLARGFASYLSLLFWGIPYLIAAGTKRRQALHDFMASTLVVRAGSSPEDVRSSPPAGGNGVVVAVVIGLLAIAMTGALAAVAIPAYQEHTIRAQVAEGLALAAPYKSAIAERANEALLDDIDSACSTWTRPTGASTWSRSPSDAGMS